MKRGIAIALCLFLCAGFSTGCSQNSGTSQDTGTSQDAVAPDATDCPDGLVLWEEYNVCAPRVDDCENPWELPIIGGGCMAIGPRGCPKLWDPDSDVDCEPGELMEYDGSACPEGFVLTEDEVACIPFFVEDGACGEMEIPDLGGGCKKVGPDWGEEGEPLFDYCEPGHLALPGGGCVQVGPRACPKLWDPESDVDCEIGDVLPCPEGWSESEDLMYCDPGYADCPPGERALVGGACERVIPLAEDCPEGPFPEVPDGATDVMYVLAGSGCVDDCGGADAPFASIQAAIDTAQDGGYVLVGEGVYDEGLLIEKPVHVAGLCAAKVTVTGVAQVPDENCKIPGAGIAVVEGAGASVTGMQVISPAVGVLVTGTTAVELRQLELTGIAGTGLYAGEEADVIAAELWIHDTLPSNDVNWLKGQGVWVQDGGVLTVQASLVEMVRGAGVYARHQGTELEMEDVVVRYTQPLDTGSLGSGIQVSKAAMAKVSGGLIDNNTKWGVVVVDSATEVELRQTVVRATKPGDDAYSGVGIELSYGATVTVIGCLLDGNTTTGVIAALSGTQLDIFSTVMRDTKPSMYEDAGTGMEVSYGARATVSGCLVERNRREGVLVLFSGTQVAISGTIVRDTKSGLHGENGEAVFAGGGALVTVSECLYEANSSSAIVLVDSGTQAELVGTVVRDTKPDENGNYGEGMRVSGGAAAMVSECLFEGNRNSAVIVTNPGTQAEFSHTVVRDTKPDGTGESGVGLVLNDGAAVTALNCLFEANTAAGIAVGHDGTQLELVSSVVQNTKCDEDGGYGVGMQVGAEATAIVSKSLFDRNRDIGIWLSQDGTKVELSQTVVRNTKPNMKGEYGLGMDVRAGAVASVSESLFQGNTTAGIAAFDVGTEVNLSDTVVRATKSAEDGVFGVGMSASDGAVVRAQKCLFEGNTMGGVWIIDSGTQAELTGMVVRDTESDEDGDWIEAMGVSGGAIAKVSGSMFEGNSTVSVLVAGTGTDVELSGTVVNDTKKALWGDLGVGVIAQAGARTVVFTSLLAQNHTSGVLAWDEGTQVEMFSSGVFDTQLGGAVVESNEQVYGDGVVAGEGAVVNIESSVLAGSGRAGVYYHHAAGALDESVVWDNSSYGLAMHECSGDVEYAGRLGDSPAGHGNYIFGNAIDLPPELAEQVTTTPGEMPVPDLLPPPALPVLKPLGPE